MLFGIGSKYIVFGGCFVEVPGCPSAPGMWDFFKLDLTFEALAADKEYFDLG
jgi:hypothetical protein